MDHDYFTMKIHAFSSILFAVFVVCSIVWVVTTGPPVSWRPTISEAPVQWRYAFACGLAATTLMPCKYIPQIWFNYCHKTAGGLGVWLTSLGLLVRMF